MSTNFDYKKKIPEWFSYLTWYDLDTPIGLYNFIDEMKRDGIDLNKFPEITVYYDILYKNAFRDDPNIITVDYVVKKLKQCLIRYGFAHSSARIDNKFYYYWYDKE